MSSWHTKTSMGRQRHNLISTIISLKIWWITPMIGSLCIMHREGGGILMTLRTKTLMMTPPCLDGSMVLPDVEFIYMWPPLRRGGRKLMGQKLNTCFKASARYARRRRHMRVRIVWTPMRSKMKFGSATLRQTVPVLHRMRISHMNLSAKYIWIKSNFSYFYAINASLLLIQFWCFFCLAYSIFSTWKMRKKTPQLMVTATSIEGKVR